MTGEALVQYFYHTPSGTSGTISLRSAHISSIVL